MYADYSNGEINYIAFIQIAVYTIIMSMDIFFQIKMHSYF